MNMLEIVAVLMHKRSRQNDVIFAALTAFLIWEPLFWIGSGAAVWSYYFFRNPISAVPPKQELTLSPADGLTLHNQDVEPPEEPDLGDRPKVRASGFMNAFKRHVNRTSATKKIKHIASRQGKFMTVISARIPGFPERNCVTTKAGKGVTIGIVQIADLVARRIVWGVREGKEVAVGVWFAYVRFGNRLVAHLLKGALLSIATGTAAITGETPLPALLTFDRSIFSIAG